ncbi:MAG: exo-alpha-sialidase [Pirellulales bacterium]
MPYPRLLAVALSVAWLAVGSAAGRGEEPELISVTRIWNEAPHNAFTDLIRHRDRWWCVFREGQGHVSPDGALRVITSEDGQHWQSAALIRSPNSDLRDAKLTVTPDDQLMLSGAEALHDASVKSHQSLAWFSTDGTNWSRRYEIGDPNFWLWRVTWHDGKAYSIGYGCGKDQSVRLYVSPDGKDFQPLVERLYDVGYPNESSIVFHGHTAWCLLRRDEQPNSGLIGTAQAPYTHWEWKDLGKQIGGPHLLQLPDGRLVAVVRLYDNHVRTSVCWVDPVAGTLDESLSLPSGGDTSYAGLAWHDDRLWVSYYSSHEGQTSIYLAQVKIPLKATK